MAHPTAEEKDRNARREAELMWSLQYHKPTDQQTARIEALRTAQAHYAEVLMTFTRPGREQSVAITDFETSCMWAIKAIVAERP